MRTCVRSRLGYLYFICYGKDKDMISVRKNPNFKCWFQIFSFGKMIDEVKRESQAIRIAEQEAKQQKVNLIYFVDQPIIVKEK